MSTMLSEGLLDEMRCALAGRFMLPAASACEIREKHRLSESQLLTALIPAATALARPAISNFKVGAVGLGKSGAVYIGVNLEFPGAQLNNSVHAEQFLLANAWWHGERDIQRLAVSAAPCGHCRQFYSELASADSLKIVFGEPPTEYGLPKLLPQRFGPADLLGSTGSPLLLDPQHNRIAFRGSSAEALQAATTIECRSSSGCTGRSLEQSRDRGGRPPMSSRHLPAAAEVTTELLIAAAEAALLAAQKAYCPYTGSPSGVALLLADGSLHWGGYLESAAFNPSFAPLQCSLTAAVREGIASYEQVTCAVLVEVPTASVLHAEAAALLLSKISPDAKLLVIPAELTN